MNESLDLNHDRKEYNQSEGQMKPDDMKRIFDRLENRLMGSISIIGRRLNGEDLNETDLDIVRNNGYPTTIEEYQKSLDEYRQFGQYSGQMNLIGKIKENPEILKNFGIDNYKIKDDEKTNDNEKESEEVESRNDVLDEKNDNISEEESPESPVHEEVSLKLDYSDITVNDDLLPSNYDKMSVHTKPYAVFSELKRYAKELLSAAKKYNTKWASELKSDIDKNEDLRKRVGIAYKAFESLYNKAEEFSTDRKLWFYKKVGKLKEKFIGKYPEKMKMLLGDEVKYTRPSTA